MVSSAPRKPTVTDGFAITLVRTFPVIDASVTAQVTATSKFDSVPIVCSVSSFLVNVHCTFTTFETYSDLCPTMVPANTFNDSVPFPLTATPSTDQASCG